MKILHITAHMGAGAGKAISGLVISDSLNENTIVVLDKPEKTGHIVRCQQKGINVVICPDSIELRKLVRESDIVVINWWHHPLTYKALMIIADLPCRLILWSHVNGLFYPHLSPGFLFSFDEILFTSDVSLHNRNWVKEERCKIEEKYHLVYGMGDFNPESLPYKVDYNIEKPIKVGYVGSLDYVKLHPDFVRWIKAATEHRQDIIFDVFGDTPQVLLQDINAFEMKDHVNLLGFVQDVKELLPKWDIFIYLLNPFSFATTENALLEAMAAGLPVIVSNGEVEQSIIINGHNGLFVSDQNDFSQKLIELAENDDLRETLGRNARNSVIERYSLSENLKSYMEALNCALIKQKHTHEFDRVIGDSPLEWFLSGCVNKDQTDFSERIFHGGSKGSVYQFLKFYPEDRSLKDFVKKQAMSVESVKK